MCEHWGAQHVTWAAEEACGGTWCPDVCWSVAVPVGKWGGVRCAGDQKGVADFVA